MSDKLKIKKVFITDSLWSILALGMMNAMTQIVLYPILRYVLGVEEYGNILFMIGIINIAGSTIGCSANSARLVASVKGITHNSDSNLWLVSSLILMLPICTIVMLMSGFEVSPMQVFLTWALTGATIWRNYADVEYRLSTDYHGYFKYYLWICVGYLLGAGLFYVTKAWQLILLPGELAGLIFVGMKGSVLKPEGAIDKSRFASYLKSVSNLAVATLLSNIVLNADRLVLKSLIGGEAVTLFYVASLIGKTVALVVVPLNSVIIGHLAKSSNNSFDVKGYLKLSGLGLVLSGIALAFCVLGSHIFASLLYPQEYEAVKNLFWIANLAQVFYFASSILCTVLLRYAKERCQVTINVAYVALFAVVTVMTTKQWGLSGFTVGLLISNTFRYLFTMLVGTIELRRRANDAV